MVPFVLVAALVSVEAVEIAHGIRQVGGIDREVVIREEAPGVVIEAYCTVMSGGISGFEEEHLPVVRITRTVTVVIDIGQYATLEAEVGIISNVRQDTEVPAFFCFFVVCVSGKTYICKQNK